MFSEKGVLINFTKYTRKHPCWKWYAFEKTNDIRYLASEVYLEPRQKSTGVLYENIVKGFRPLTLFAKSSMFYVKCLTGSWIHFWACNWSYKPNINPFQPSVAFLIKTSHLICIANQMTALYKDCSTGMKRVKIKESGTTW